MRATQSIPGGFLLIFFGLLAWAFAALAGYAGWLVYQREELLHEPTEYSYNLYFSMGAGGLLVGVLLVYWGLKQAWRTPPYDTRDPNEPGFKW